MASNNDSIITGRLKGLLGKQLVFRHWEGKIVVAKAPKSRDGEPTPGQARTQGQFLRASRYASSVVNRADTSMAVAYSSALRVRQNVYCRAMEDFLTAPVVDSIDTEEYRGAVGDKLLIRAVDDFRVTRVKVEIFAADGSLLESGDTVQGESGIDWTYAATQVNNLLAGTKIKATATDVPGNKGTLEITL